MRTLRFVCERHGHAIIRIVAVGGEGFRPVEHPMLAVTHRRRSCAACKHWVLNGAKTFTTNGHYANYCVEPASGSVSDQAPIAFPEASGTRYFFFCASVPNLKMWFEHSELCAATIKPTEPSTRDSSSIATAYSM